MNEQELFWKEIYGEKYINKNNQFNNDKGIEAWERMLKRVPEKNFSILECGSNIGKNIQQINNTYPGAKCSIIEINNKAFEICKCNNRIDKSFNGSILDCNFAYHQFDIVFTMGVLIHIHPENLLENLSKIVKWSNRYILIGEYFNRTESSLKYQGEENKLFKRDFGKYFLENFDGACIDYGFLWSKEFEGAGFDDITWWLFDLTK